MDTTFDSLYREVFTDDNTVKACGREKCKQLIAECNRIKPGTDFGNIETGYMNVVNIIRLKNNLNFNFNTLEDI
ncbi:MAG: hypothetical protein IJ593_09410 [Lachnospiraceae bacterium]|nr:hypothetical protein [Lachnospiraceae bacterium]